MRRFKSSRRMSDATASSTGSEEKDSSAVESTDISVHSDEEDDDDKLDQDYDVKPPFYYLHLFKTISKNP